MLNIRRPTSQLPLIGVILVIVALAASDVLGKPVADVGSAEVGVAPYQYDGANEFNVAQYQAPNYDAGAGAYDTSAVQSSDDDDDGNSSSSSEYDDYYQQQQQRRRRLAEESKPESTQKPEADPSSDDEARRLATVAISDLVGAVEHTLVHSAQKLAASNASDAAAFNSIETSTVIALPIHLPEETSTTTTTTAEPELDGSVQTVKPSDSLNLLSVIAVGGGESTSTTTTTTTTTTTNSPLIPILDTAQNISIIQTINSTQVHAASTDANGDERPEHVQQQHITLFSAGAGVFPNIPSVQLDRSAASANASSSSEEDDSASSDESAESSSEEKDCDESVERHSSSEETKPKPKVKKCKLPVAVAVKEEAATTVKSVEDVAVEQQKVEKLKEKIAEVEAEPVILTQGI